MGPKHPTAASLPSLRVACARLALARSSTLPVAAVWQDPPADAGSDHRRGALLAAGYLARRGLTAPWSTMKLRAAAADRALVDRIDAYLRGKIG